MSDLYTSIIFSTEMSDENSWGTRDVAAIRIKFPSVNTSTNYTAEMLGVAVAASLPLTHSDIYTDAKGIVTSMSKTLQQQFTSTSLISPHLPRNYTETGLLYKHIILNQSKITLHHIKAHQEDSSSAKRTEHGTGNRIADLVAQGDIQVAQSLCNTLHISTCDVNTFITPPTTPPLITIGTTPSQHDFYMHHPNTTAKAFHTACINDWLTQTRPKTTAHSPLPWSDLTWNLAGSIITKYSKTPSSKLFLLKVLYDALPNGYTKHKYATKPRHTIQSPFTNDDMPVCALCSTSAADSLSHLLCNCPHPQLHSMRQQLTHTLTNITTLLLDPISHLFHSF